MAKIGCLKPFRGSYSNLANIVLEDGEIAFTTDNKRLYMGNGTNSISGLYPFINAGTTDISNIGDGSITGAISTINSNSVETGTLTWTRRDNPSVTITTDYTIVDDLIFAQIWNVPSLKNTDWTIFDLTNSSKTFARLGHQTLINDSNTYTGYIKGEIAGQVIGIYRNFSGGVNAVGTLIARVLS